MFKTLLAHIGEIFVVRISWKGGNNVAWMLHSHCANMVMFQWPYMEKCRHFAMLSRYFLQYFCNIWSYLLMVQGPATRTPPSLTTLLPHATIDHKLYFYASWKHGELYVTGLIKRRCSYFLLLLIFHLLSFLDQVTLNLKMSLWNVVECNNNWRNLDNWLNFNHIIAIF